MYTHGEVKKLYPNGRIVYAGQVGCVALPCLERTGVMSTPAGLPITCMFKMHWRWLFPCHHCLNLLLLIVMPWITRHVYTASTVHGLVGTVDGCAVVNMSDMAQT